MVCRRPPGRTSALCRAVQSRVPRSGLTPDYATLIRIAAPLDDASTTREAEVASTLTLPPKQRGRESTGGCQVLRFVALLTRPEQHPRLALSDSRPCRNHASPQDRTRFGSGMVPRGRRAGPSAATASLVSLAVAEPPHPRTGDPSPWGEPRPSRRRHPRRARQLTSQASRACSRYARVLVIDRPVRIRALGRNLALDLSRPSGVGVTVASYVAAAHHRPARRAGAIGLAALGGRAVRGQPAGRVRRPFGPRSPRRLGPHPPARGRIAASSSSSRSPPVMVAVAVVYWLSLSLGGPFHLRCGV